MSESLIIDKNVGKKEKYESLIPQLVSLTHKEKDTIANMANICAALKEVFHFFWVGFYIVKKKELILGPFQGTIACTRIQYGRGVCGYAWEQKKTIIVPDVEKFPGHIACSALSRSEIVVPLFKNKEVFAVLDIDSEQLNSFDEIDSFFLEKIVKIIYS
ncbi:MAG: GAF domain-containing protein [Chitinophagaceae bacterium]|nr:GAF domain-containing protein [Chitinophagaceae bacterium]